MSPTAAVGRRFSPTAFVAAALASLPPTRMDILDLGCGYGRHALWLTTLGHRVTGIDIDEERASAVRRISLHQGRVAAIVADGRRVLPLREATFDLVLVVHFVPERLVELASPALRSGGYLIVETFGGHGGNWRDLPGPGQLRAELGSGFDILSYQERAVGPTKSEAVSVKFIAQRR